MSTPEQERGRAGGWRDYLNRKARINEAAPEMYKALEQIVKMEGPFKRDQLEHAEAVIEHNRNIARAALLKATAGQQGDEGAGHQERGGEHG